MANWLENRITAAKSWASQNSPAYQMVQQKSFKPLGRAIYNMTANQSPLDAVTSVMPVGKVKSYIRHSDAEIKSAFNSFQNKIPRLKPKPLSTRVAAENARINGLKSVAFNNVNRANKIRRQLNGFIGSPEAKFRELINRIK